MSEKELNTNQRIEQHKPIEVWEDSQHGWKWEVYKKYQKPANEAKNPYARWYCKVYSPYVPEGEIGDTYVADIKKYALKVK